MTINSWIHLEIAENGLACNKTDEENVDDDGEKSNGIALTRFD